MLNFDKMPDEAYEKPKEGVRNWEITSCELAVAKKTGSHMIVFGYTSLDAGKVKLNYDNCPIADAQGNSIRFGQSKLKKILKATGVKPEGDFSPRILPKLLLGKHLSFSAEYDKDGKYLKLNNIDTILPANINPENVTPQTFMDNETDFAKEITKDERKEESENVQEVDITDSDWEIN